jgi:aminoglycoside 6'-N-acetyltransferase I
MIEACTSVEQPGWLHLRYALWPDCPAAEHLAEMHSFLAQPERFAQYVFYSEPALASSPARLRGFRETERIVCFAKRLT